MASLSGRVALVVGASRGIGADIARYLARSGAIIAVAARSEDVRDPRLPGTIYTVADEIRLEGGSALPVVLNVRERGDIDRAIGEVTARSPAWTSS